MELYCRQQPHCQPVAGTGFNPVTNGAGRGHGYSRYEGAQCSRIARDFSSNFDYFRTPGTAFVSRDSLQHAAGRPPTGNPYHDQMTLLARSILNNPKMEHLLDAINHGGQEDGVISHGDVSAVVDHYEAQEAPFKQSPRSGPYNGAMQQQRVNQQFPQPHFGQSPGYDNSNFAAQQPYYGGGQVLRMPDAESKSYTHLSKEDFSNQVLSHFSSLEDPNTPGAITDRSLNAVASGYRLDGTPATQDEINIAKELLARGSLFKELDEGKTGTLDGSFTRDDLGNTSNRFKGMSDEELLKTIKANFVEYGDGDDYVNFKELKQAAGLLPSDKTYSPEARQAAAELLKRKQLLEDTDVGVDDKGGPGYKDGRFDLANLDHVIDKKRATAAG